MKKLIRVILLFFAPSTLKHQSNFFNSKSRMNKMFELMRNFPKQTIFELILNQTIGHLTVYVFL